MPIHEHAATLVQLMNECLLIASTSLDLIEKINNYVDPILELSLQFLKPRACDQIELQNDENQYYNRVELLFLDSSNRLPCARTQFAYMLRNSTKQPGISAIMITKCLTMLNHGPADLKLGCLTMLFMLLETSFASELQRTSSALDAAIKCVGDNPVAFAYILMFISKMPQQSNILENLPLTQECIVEQVRHPIVQAVLETVLQNLIARNKKVMSLLAPRILQRTCELEDVQSLTTLMALVNECFLSKEKISLAIDVSTKTMLRVIRSLDLDEVYKGFNSRAIQTLLEILENTFGPLLKGEKEALAIIGQPELHSYLIDLICQILQYLGERVNNSNVTVVDELILKTFETYIILKKRKLQ